MTQRPIELCHHVGVVVPAVMQKQVDGADVGQFLLQNIEAVANVELCSLPQVRRNQRTDIRSGFRGINTVQEAPLIGLERAQNV